MRIRRVVEAVRAIPLLHYSTPQANGYDWTTGGGFAMKDGSINVYCYYDTPNAPKVDAVRIALPVD